MDTSTVRVSPTMGDQMIPYIPTRWFSRKIMGMLNTAQRAMASTQGDAEAGLFGQAHAPHQVGQHVGQDGGHSPQHDDAEGVLAGVDNDGVLCPQEPQGGLHHQPQPGAVGHRQHQPQIEAEDADLPGLGLLPGPQQPGDQGADP